MCAQYQRDRERIIKVMYRSMVHCTLTLTTSSSWLQEQLKDMEKTVPDLESPASNISIVHWGGGGGGGGGSIAYDLICYLSLEKKLTKDPILLQRVRIGQLLCT